jgi:hypothetical protein
MKPITIVFHDDIHEKMVVVAKARNMAVESLIRDTMNRYLRRYNRTWHAWKDEGAPVVTSSPATPVPEKSGSWYDQHPPVKAKELKR